LLAAAAAALWASPLPAQQPAESRGVIHTWRRIYYGVLDGQTSLLFFEGLDRSKPALGDLDGDGDLDLVVGTADGHLAYFENQGTAKKPVWRLVNEALSALPQSGAVGADPDTPQAIALGANAAPALVDIDGDGDLDLFVGNAAGKLAFYRNIGNRYLAMFRLESPDVLGASLGLNLVPTFADVNGDGLPDLTLGNEAGEVYLLYNQGTRAAQRYCARTEGAPPECLAVPEKLLQLSGADNAVPEWVDWNRDGVLDLMVGKNDGTVAYYSNIGTRLRPALEQQEARFNILDIGGYAAPAFADLNGDGIPDLLLAGDGERMAWYRTQMQGHTPELWLEDSNALQARRLGRFDTRIHVAAGELFGHGRPDLVVGTASGQLLVYENLGGQDLPAFRASGDAILPTSQRGFSAPALVDLDGDGLLDLVVGDRNGRLELIRNVGTKQGPKWRAGELFLGRVDVGALSVPLFSDVDGDGLPDLLVGSNRGQVILYRNTGTAQQPAFQLTTTRFGGVTVGAAAAPSLFAWNPKAPPDLVVGSRDGSLLHVVRNPNLPVSDRGAFQAQAQPWTGLRAPSYSAPLFADLTGGGRPYLLLGTGRGEILLWRYEGSVSPEQIARQARRGGGNAVGRPPPLRAGEKTPASEWAEADGPAGAPIVAATSPPAAAQAAGPPGQEPVFVLEPGMFSGVEAGKNTAPAFLDYNGDGRPDLVVGNHEGRLLLFENLGPAALPRWKLVPDGLGAIRVGRNAAPVFGDLRGSGTSDLIVGMEDGSLAYFENTGSAAQPRFTRRPDALRGVRVGSNAMPALADLDGDGTLELLIGSLRGNLMYYRRKSARSLDFDLIERRFVGLEPGVNASPSFGDLVQKGRPVLLIGSDRGPVRILERTSTSPFHSSGWRDNPTFLAGQRIPPGSHPVLVDLDGDGDLDLAVGTAAGPLLFFRNQAVQKLDETPPAANNVR
jgi:hypothetical protein